MFFLHPIRILLVEDNPSDARLIQECFRDAKMKCQVDAVEDGEEALRYLRRQHPFICRATPDLILLDLELPKLHGLKVLELVKADADLRRIPVVILTASSLAENILKAYDLQASCYLAKPKDWDGFVELVKSLERFWLQRVTLPPHPAADE